TITVPKGGGKLRISRAGFEIKTQDVTLSDKGTTIAVKLEPAPVVPWFPQPDQPPAAPNRDTPPPAGTRANLLRNPGCEEPLVNGKIPGWTMVTGHAWTRRTSDPRPF